MKLIRNIAKQRILLGLDK